MVQNRVKAAKLHIYYEAGGQLSPEYHWGCPDPAPADVSVKTRSLSITATCRAR